MIQFNNYQNQNKMYNEQFELTLKGGVYAGSAEYADLRIIFQEILQAIKQVSVLINRAEVPVLLSEVDARFVLDRANLVMDRKAETLGIYAPTDILETLSQHIARINTLLKDELKALQGKNSVMPMFSVFELREKGLVQ
ncbi:hypothetical protein [Pedobacter xixiisoli]|nr:hypothetical protein [Pedobacter xixiisoli]